MRISGQNYQLGYKALELGYTMREVRISKNMDDRGKEQEEANREKNALAEDLLGGRCYLFS